MKNIVKIIISVIALLLSLVLGVFAFRYAASMLEKEDKVEETEEFSSDKEYDDSELVVADISEYELVTTESSVYEMTISKLNTFKGSGLVFVGYPDCYWCNRGMPVFNEVASEIGNIPFYYVHLNVPISNEDYAVLLEKSELIRKDGNEDIYTPLTLAIKDGEVVDASFGTVPYDTENQDDFNEEEREEQKNNFREMVAKIIN